MKDRIKYGLLHFAYIPVYIDPRNWFDEARATRSLIYYSARLLGYSPYNADFLVKQSNLETGFQQLGFYAQGTNNLFGMHKPRKRETVNGGSIANEAEGGEMLVYHSALQSIYDRYLWDEYHGFTEDGTIKDASYTEAVQQKNYNPSSSYTDDVLNTDTKLGNLSELLWRTFLIVILLLIILAGYYLGKFLKFFK